MIKIANRTLFLRCDENKCKASLVLASGAIAEMLAFPKILELAGKNGWRISDKDTKTFCKKHTPK